MPANFKLEYTFCILIDKFILLMNSLSICWCISYMTISPFILIKDMVRLINFDNIICILLVGELLGHMRKRLPWADAKVVKVIAMR